MNGIFLIGAGASAEAGVPLMNRFVADLRAELDESLVVILDLLVKNIEPAAEEGVVDVEVLLHALNQLRDKSNLTMAALGQQRPSQLGADKLEELERRVRAYVRRRCSEGITPDRLGYLRPLLDFRTPSSTLDIFSLNYDMCIEMLAEQAGLRYTDGFQPYWSDTSLDDPGKSDDPLIRLHKIHGSLVWYERSGFRYVKMPILPTEDELRYFDHETVAEMLLYPALVKEGNDRGPYPSLVMRFRNRLESAGVLVVIGYGFRDSYIRTMVTEAAMQNPRLSIALVDPLAQQLKRKHLNHPELARRVVAHSVKTGEALREGALYKFVQDLELADSLRHDAERNRPTSPGIAKRTLSKAAAMYMGLGHNDAVRAMVEEDEEVNPEKAISWEYHPLPRLDACLAFALCEGTIPGVWWRLLTPLLYWWERQLFDGSLEGVRPSLMPRVNPLGYSFELPPAERAEGIVSAYETAWDQVMKKPYPESLLQRFHVQMGRLLDLERVRRDPALAPGEREARQARIKDEYLAEESPGNLAWRMGEADTPRIPGLIVDWKEMKLVLSN